MELTSWEKPTSSRQWEPDSAAKRCRGCSVKFSLLTRRHHCRNCGKVFCSNCTTQSSAIEGIYNERVRVCDSCFSKLTERGAALKANVKLRVGDVLPPLKWLDSPHRESSPFTNRSISYFFGLLWNESDSDFPAIQLKRPNVEAFKEVSVAAQQVLLGISEALEGIPKFGTMIDMYNIQKLLVALTEKTITCRKEYVQILLPTFTWLAQCMDFRTFERGIEGFVEAVDHAQTGDTTCIKNHIIQQILSILRVSHSERRINSMSQSICKKYDSDATYAKLIKENVELMLDAVKRKKYADGERGRYFCLYDLWKVLSKIAEQSAEVLLPHLAKLEFALELSEEDPEHFCCIQTIQVYMNLVKCFPHCLDHLLPDFKEVFQRVSVARYFLPKIVSKIGSSNENLSSTCVEILVQWLEVQPSTEIRINILEHVLKWTYQQRECIAPHADKIKDQLRIPNREVQLLARTILDVLRKPCGATASDEGDGLCEPYACGCLDQLSTAVHGEVEARPIPSSIVSNASAKSLEAVADSYEAYFPSPTKFLIEDASSGKLTLHIDAQAKLSDGSSSECISFVCSVCLWKLWLRVANVLSQLQRCCIMDSTSPNANEITAFECYLLFSQAQLSQTPDEETREKLVESCILSQQVLIVWLW